MYQAKGEGEKNMEMYDELTGKYTKKPLSSKRKVIDKQTGQEVKKVSDLDIAFYSYNLKKGYKSYSNEDTNKKLRPKINEKYGNDVVMHGDNANGVKMKKSGALRV